MALGIERKLESRSPPGSTVDIGRRIPVLHHSLITTSPDALKFDAAAFMQLESGNRPLDYHLISSPYNEQGHLLDLTTLDKPNQLLARALTILKPTRKDYATADYASAFNWQVVMELLRDLASSQGYEWKEQSFYVVIFRSHLQQSASLSYLHELDSHSHEEATKSGGLLKYWFGTAGVDRRNLATCEFGSSKS